MNESLKKETEKLARSWMQHEAGWLRDYLVAGVEDPRINVQSILSRHFLIQAVTGESFGRLMRHEYRFAAMMNWLLSISEKATDPEELSAVLFGFRQGADDAEGIPIPHWALSIFATLPAKADGVEVPNYVEGFLNQTRIAAGTASPDQESLNTFCRAWRGALAPGPARIRVDGPGQLADGQRAMADGHQRAEDRISVLEPACGSANDFRFLEAYGIAALVDYTGFDLCARNIENARALFPGVRFETANVFEIPFPNLAIDFCIVHDLFEHLSMDGLATAVSEICRVTRKSICAAFFQMDEIAGHVVRPVDDYHWNLLSMSGMKELFAKHGFAAQAVHIGTFLRDITGCNRTHNPNAYTFLAERS